MKLVLTEIGGNDFSEFPDSLYLARKVLGLKDMFHSFVPCPKCHKLHRKQEVENFQQDGSLTIMTCRHVEFPNSLHRRSCAYNTALSQITKATIQNFHLPVFINNSLLCSVIQNSKIHYGIGRIVNESTIYRWIFMTDKCGKILKRRTTRTQNFFDLKLLILISV